MQSCGPPGIEFETTGLKHNQLRTISIQFTGPTDCLSSSHGSPFNTTPINLILGDQSRPNITYPIRPMALVTGALLLHSPEFKGLKMSR